MAVLYQKYRPQNFSEIVGQKYIIQTLKNQVKNGQAAHAYLFCGSRGVGKTSAARILAKAVNCLKPEKGEPCGKCEICRQISVGGFMDLVEIDAASHTGVDDIRELIEHVKFSPSQGKYKVFIIDEVHMLSKGAFNALLKTLEEPPSHAMFILATTDVHKVPPTIISRTQRFDFKRLTTEEIASHLVEVAKGEKAEISKPVLELVAKGAEGSLRDSLSILDKALSLGQNPPLEEVQALLGVTDIGWSEKILGIMSGGKISEVPGFFEELENKGADPEIFNRSFLEYMRACLVAKAGGEASLARLDPKHEKTLSELILPLPLSEIIYFTRLFLKSLKDIQDSPDPFVPLMVAALEGAEKRKTPGTTSQEKIPSSPQVSVRNSARDAATDQGPGKAFMSQAIAEAPKAEIRAEEEGEGLDEVEMKDVEKFWPKVVQKVSEKNMPLGNLLKNSRLLGSGGGILEVEVKFLFHKQSLELPKNRQLVHTLIKEICGKNLRVRAAFKETKETTSGALTGALDDALKVFGGELVN